ncbi:MAG: Signal transduction histidine kinase [Mucilaginibacter sp.]|nr:Signal transduction histidine kinase [Mucilaginibacter sp.]
MKAHFFKNLPGKYKIIWRNYYTGQNLLLVRVGSVIFLLLTLIIRVLYQVFPESLSRAENFPEFNLTSWAFIVLTFIFYICSNILIEYYKKTEKATAIMSLFVLTFSLYIILFGIFASFVLFSNSQNALTLYLIALTIISLLFVFEYYETIILIIAAELSFVTVLIQNHTHTREIVYNQFVSVVLLVGFYLISRYFFIYKANYYLQMIEIKEKNIEIEKGSEFKSQLLGIVAHDLRNPIAAVESIAMIMEMEDIDEETKDNLNLMKSSCVKAHSIIDELLEAARNENVIEFVTQKTELNEFLKGIIDVWKKQNGTKNNIKLTSSVNPAYAQIDHEKFYRVLDNLTDNAIKFSQEKSKVEIFLKKKDTQIIIEVKDYGIGIPKDKLPLVFDPFTKAGRTGLKGEQSTGLGLSIVKQIVEKHKGQIEVESEEGKGSVFRVTLPEG